MNNDFKEFDEFIMRDLIESGLTGDDLSSAFNAKKKQLRTAVESMLNEAHNAAQGSGEYATYEDIFDAELLVCARERLKNCNPDSVITANELYDDLGITEDDLSPLRDVELE